MILRVSVRCIALNNDRILVQLSKRGDFYRLPGGRVRPDETLIQALRRELLEELGVEKVEPVKLLYIVESFYKRKNSVVHDIGFYFYCTGISGDITPKEEHIRVKWIPLSEISKDNFRPVALAEMLKRDLGKAGNSEVKETLYLVNIEME